MGPLTVQFFGKPIVFQESCGESLPPDLGGTLYPPLVEWKEKENASEPPDNTQAIEGPLIECRGLCKSFGKLRAVVNLDLKIYKGEFFGFLGPNGSGKSTTINMLTTLLLPSEGTMRVAGLDPVTHPFEVKRIIGTLPEEIHTFERLTVSELIQFTGRVRGIARQEVMRRSKELLDLMEIAQDDHKKLMLDCSMGMRKKVVLASALLHAPRVLFLDEPFNGIDVRTSLSIRKILTQLTETGTTIFFSSHILEIVEKLCGRIAIIDHGELKAIGTREELAALSGLGPEANLDEIFLRLVGENDAGGAGLSWLSSSSS